VSKLRDRAASIFGQLAVAAGTHEAMFGETPTYVYLPVPDCRALHDYLQRVRATPKAKRVLVSGLEVRAGVNNAKPLVG
jgi:hypothetical protein